MFAQSYSILIPHVFMNISNETIVNAFEKYNLGKIDQIDSVIKTSHEGYNYRMVFVHFKYWNMNNNVAVNLKYKIEDPNKEARLVYDDPWYWLLLPAKKTENKTIQRNNMKNLIKEQIDRLEREVDCIYEELYGREFIPTLKSEPEWYASNNVVSRKNHSVIYPMEEEYDDVINISDDELITPPVTPINDSMNTTECDSTTYNEDDIENVYNEELFNKEYEKLMNYYYYHHNEKSNLKPREWMTQNICDNA